MQIEPLGQFSLDMLQAGIVAAGPNLQHSPELLTRLQIDLLAACMHVFRDTGPLVASTQRVPSHTITRMCQVMLSLYMSNRACFILQVDTFIQVRRSSESF
jgi:hypothetical protein